MISELDALGKLEIRRLVSARLVYVQPFRAGAAAIEVVVTDSDAITYLAIENLLELEFAEDRAEQETALELIELAIDGGVADVRSGTKHWAALGVGEDSGGEFHVVRRWEAWREHRQHPGKHRLIRTR